MVIIVDLIKKLFTCKGAQLKNIVIIAILGLFIYHNFFKVEEFEDYSTSLLPKETVVVAFGDSLTYGTGASQAQSYPAQLSKMVGVPVINLGIPGERSAEGLRRLPAILEKHKPHILLLCHGGNDILQKLDLDKTKDNLEQMIHLAQARGTTVVLIGVPTWSALYTRTAGFYDDLAQEAGVAYEDGILATIINDNTLKKDPVHPNSTGYRLMAEKVRDAIFANYTSSINPF